MRLLVVEDEKRIADFLSRGLQSAGYAVDTVNTGGDAVEMVHSTEYDLVVLDLGLPDMDGQEVLLQLRRFCSPPVIVLSARDRPAEKIAALDAGANDYVEKPFDIGELLARIRAALRVEAGGREQVALFVNPPLEMDLVRRLVRVEGAPVALTPREYDLLALLVRNTDRVITHRQMLTAVWGPAHSADVQYLRVYVGHLRQKLGAAAAAHLVTEPGVGYRMLGPAT